MTEFHPLCRGAPPTVLGFLSLVFVVVNALCFDDRLMIRIFVCLPFKMLCRPLSIDYRCTASLQLALLFSIYEGPGLEDSIRMNNF